MEASSHHIENILIFLEELRENGFLISTAEAAQVVAMLRIVGLTNREAVRAGLCAMLSKDRKQMQEFYTRFDTFFVPEHVIFQRDAQQISIEKERAKKMAAAREELQGTALPDEVTEAFADVSEKRKQWLRNMISRVNDSPRHLPLAEEYLKKMATGWMASGGAEGVQKKQREESDLLHKSLTAITEDEVPQALSLIEILVRRINGAAQRKYKRSIHRSHIDLRATIHRSLQTGGVPVYPQYKSRPRSNRRVVILCDVSESMYRFSGFALRFITALGNTANKTTAYIFSEGIEEIDLSGLSSFEETVRQSKLWRLGTDAGNALEHLVEMPLSPLNPQTLLIVLSDAKTINPTFAVSMLEEAARRSRSVLWLNPDGQDTKLAAELAQHCTMLECGTLNALSKACAKVSAL